MALIAQDLGVEEPATGLSHAFRDIRCIAARMIDSARVLSYPSGMHMRAHSGRRWEAAVLLAALALILRMLIPSGWMPAEDRLALVPCFGIAPMKAQEAVQSAHHSARLHDHSKRNTGEKADKPCAFSGFACALAEPDTSSRLNSPVRYTAYLPPLSTAVSIGAGLPAPPPPQTGPPTVS